MGAANSRLGLTRTVTVSKCMRVCKHHMFWLAWIQHWCQGTSGYCYSKSDAINAVKEWCPQQAVQHCYSTSIPPGGSALDTVCLWQWRQFHISEFRLHISDFIFHMLDFRFHISDFRFCISDLRFEISHFRFQVQISDFIFQISEFRF